MNELREQIAERLLLAYRKAGRLIDVPRDVRTGYLAMADEVIRLMEWARLDEPMVAGLLGCRCGHMHVAGHPIFTSPGHQMLEVGEKMPLTLPPPEWKP